MLGLFTLINLRNLVLNLHVQHYYEEKHKIYAIVSKTALFHHIMWCDKASDGFQFEKANFIDSIISGDENW